MKRALFIFFIFISVCSYSQNIKVIGPDTTTGRPGYLFTLKPQYTSTPLYAVNDSTLGSHAIDSLKRTPGTVGVYGRKNGVFVWQYDDSVGTGGGGGGGPADSAYFWSRTGNVALSTDWLGTKTATSLRIRTNNTPIAVFDSVGNIGFGTATPATSFHSFGVTSVGDSATATNSVRQFNVIGNNAVIRTHRVSPSAGAASPSVELVHSTTKNGTIGVYWDMFADSVGYGIRDRNAVGALQDTVARIAIMKATYNVQIGNNRVDIPSALFSLSSTTKGFLPPRLTTVQRNAISSPATGLVIYNTTNTALEWYNGSSWLTGYSGGAYTLAIGNSITSGTAGSIYYGGTSGALAQDNANLFYDGTNHRVGIANAAPGFRLDVGGGGAGATAEVIRINAGATGIAGTYYSQNGTLKALFGVSGIASDFINGSATGDFNIRNVQRILFSADAGTTAAANINSSNRWFFGGTTSATAIVHIKAGTATASTAPLKFTSGTNLTTPESGAVEFDGTRFYVTVGSVRYYADMTLTGTAAPATTPAAIGIHFLDTTNKKEYVATGTASSADWTILN